MKMKETNLSKYQHQTDKYKTKKSKIEASRSHSISRRVTKKRDSFRAYESDHEVDYKRDSLGERGFEQDKYKAVEQSQERCSRPRGRLQLRLKKVKQGVANEAAETVSKCKTAVESNTKLIANESRQTGSDLVCVYNVTDSDVDDDIGRQKLNVLLKKYRTSVNTEQNVHKGYEQSKQEKEGFEIDGDDHGDEHMKYAAVKDSADMSSLRRHKSRQMEQYSGRSGKWKRREKHRNISFSESESEFEVEEEQDLCKTFRRVRSRRSRIAELKKSAELATAEGETEKLDESELKTSDEESEQDNVCEEFDENQTGNVECKFCQKVFETDYKLDNHYMTHFKTVEGLNTFLNQRRQQKCSLSSSVNSSSILKHSANSNSHVKKKVVFEMDVDEGVDCRSPEINNCEIIDLLSDGDYTFGSDSETTQNEGELDTNETFIEVKKEDEMEIGEKLRPLVATTDDVNDSDGLNETYKFTINVDGERLYCTHNIEMAKSCLQKNVKIVLTPLKFMNEKSVEKAVTEMNVKDYEVGLMNEHWSVANKLVENDNSTKLTNIRHMNEDSKTHDKGALKLTLSKKVKTGKGNDQNLGKKSRKRSSNKNARHRSDLKRGNEKGDKTKISLEENNNMGNITLKTTPVLNGSDLNSSVSNFDLNRSLDRVPSKDSKIVKKKVRSRSVESGSKNRVLDIDSIKKDLIGWTKEFEKMKTLTENIAKSKLLDPNVGKDKSLEMKNKVGNTVITDASKKRSKKHKTTKREKEDKTVAEQSRENDGIDHSAKQGKTESSKKRKVKRESCSEKLFERSDKLHGKTGQKAEQSNEVSVDVQYIHGKMSDSAGGVIAMASETQTFQHKQKCGHSEGDLSNYSQGVCVDKEGKTSEAKEKMLNSSTNLKFPQKTDKSIKNTSWTERSKKIKSDNMQIEIEKKKIVSTAKVCKEKHTRDQNEQNIKANLKSVEKCEVKKNPKRTGLSEKGVRNTACHRKGRKRLISKEFVSSSEDSDIEGKPIGKTDLKTKSEDKKYETLSKKNEVKNNEVNQCMEHSKVKNSHLISKDEEASVQHGENRSYIEKSKNKLEKNNLERKYEVQGNLEKIQSYIISREDYFAKKSIEDSASRPRDVKGRFQAWSGTDEDKGIHQNSRINEQLELLHKNRITDVLKIGSEISSESFDQNDILLMEPPTDDDTKIYDSCYDEILIEFAEDVDIVLNSPDKAALMFDESALYNDLEKLSSKDSINSDDITHSTEENRVNNVESAENIDGQTYVDIKDKECRNETQSACKSDTDVNRTSVEDLDKTENSLVIASSELQANDDPDSNQSACLNLTGLSPKIEKKRKRNGENNSHVEVPKEKAKFETEFSQRNVVQIHSRHFDKFETEKLANSKNAKKGKQTRIIELPEIVLCPRKEENLETESQLKIKEKLEEEAETAVDLVDAVEEMGQPVEKGIQELNISKKHDENRTETNLKQNVCERKNETEKTFEAERGSSLNSEFISVEVNPKHKKRKHSHFDNSGHKHKHRKTEPSEIENEKTVTEIVEIRLGESIETQNSSGCKHNDVSGMFKHSLNEVQRNIDDVTLNKFYRCEKCNKLFHGVPNFDLKSCVSCAEKLAKNSDGYKYNDLEGNKLADVKDTTNQKEEIQQKVDIAKTNADSKVEFDMFSKANELDPTNSSEDVPVQIKESPKSYQSTCSSDKQKKLKLVIQKMKMSSFKSVDYKCKFTGSPEQPQWKVKNFEMNETPLKLTLTNAGDGNEEVNDFDAQDNLKIRNSEQVNTGNKIHSEIKESAGKLSKFVPRKEAENLKHIKDRKTENITSRTDGKSKKSENSLKKGSTLKVEPKGNKSDHLKKKNQCSDAQNEFEKALWKEHEMKTKEKSRKKDVARSKVKREHPHNGEMSNTVDNRTLLFKERRCNWSFSSNDPVQHFQKSKIAQMIYNKHQKEIVDDGLPDFSDAKLDLGSLPPLCVSAKNLSVTNDTNKGNDIYSFCKEINLSESSSSSASSVSSSTAEASRMNTDVKTAAFASVTEATNFSKVSDTVGSGFDKESNRCSGNETGISASATTGFARSLESDQAAIDFNRVRTNGVSAKTVASDNRNEENNAKHLKDLKKELEAIVMHKDNKLKDLMKSFAPGSAFSPPWSKEKNEKVSNHSTPILPSFSETFSKNLSPLPVNQNQTFPGFTKCDNVPGFNVSSKSFGTESSYSDDESAFTELSEHGIDTDKKLDKPGVVSVFDRLGKRKLSEESNSTIVPLQGQNSSPVKTDNVSPVYSPKVPELTVAEHQEEITKDFSSTPAVKSSSTWNARSDEHRLALDISCISRCSSGASEESSDVPKQKRRKITRLEIPECASKGVDVQEKKNNVQDSQMPSMLILSAECSQMDMTKLQGSIVSKSLEEEQTKVSDLNNIKDLSRHAETEFSAGFVGNETGKESDISVSSSTVKYPKCLQVGGGLEAEDKVDNEGGNSVDEDPSQDSCNKTMVEENIEESSSCNISIANIKEKTGEYFRVEDENEKELVASLNNDTNSHVDESERINKEYEDEELDIDLECKDDRGEYVVEVAVEGVVNVQNYEVIRNDTVSKLTENIANVLLNGDVHTNKPDDLLEIKESAKSSRTEESIPVFTGNVDIDETENETEEHFNLEEISEAQYESDRESEVHTNTEETRDTPDSEAENTDTEYEEERETPDSEAENTDAEYEEARDTPDLEAEDTDTEYEEARDTPDLEAEDTDTEYEEERETPDSEAEDLDTGTEVDEVEDRECIDTSKSDVDAAEEEVIDDVLELYASDEEASFLLDSAEPSPPTPGLVQNKAKMEIDKEESNETRDMELETNSSSSDTPVIETNVPVNVQAKIPANVQTNTPVNVPTSSLPDHLPTQPCEVPVFQPIRSNPIKTRWLPTGWCFRYFNRKPCSKQCTFRHDNPTEEVLSRCLPEIVEKCKKGELNSGMNMLESQSFFMNNICQDDLDCLYGYSVNHLNMEYCHKLLQLIANRNLVKQGHIDDIIYLWKRIVYCEDTAPLKDAFYVAKEKNIYPQHRAVLVLLEVFSAYSDGYMLWDVILYCTQQEDFVIPQQFINKAVTMLIACGDMSLVSAAVGWLEKASPEQLSNTNNELLSRLGNKLQQGNMCRIASSVLRCLQNKRKSLRGSGQQNIPSLLSLNQVTENTVTDTGQPAVKQRRPVTPTNVDLSDLRSSEQGKASHQLNTNLPSRAVTPVNLDSADISWHQVPQLLSTPLQPRTVTPTKQDSSASRNRYVEHQSLSDKKSSREVTPTKLSNSGSSGINEQVVNDRNILEEMKTASETSNYQELADLFIEGCKTCEITPEVFEQLLLALTRDDSIIGEVWREFIQHIKQKQIEDPDLKLDSYSLSILGSEIFYFCRRMGLRDAGDILLVILDTEFLSLSQFVSHRWNVNLELEAAEFLSNIRMAGKAAELVLEFSSSSLECPEVKTRLWNILLPLTEQLCTDESYTLAFQIFCMAFMWKYRGLRKIASDLIESCLRVKLVDVPTQIYELYITDNRKFDIRETVKRSLLNALVETKIEDGKRLFLDMKLFTAGGLFLEQSYEKPRCIWIQSVHTCNEIKLIIGQYLDDLYNKFCGQIAENISLTSEDLFLDVAINKPATQGNPVGVPYVGTAMVLPSSVKMILLSEFGIESDLSHQGAVKVTVCPASLEKYMKNLDLQGHNIGLEFSTNDLVQNMIRHKIKR